MSAISLHEALADRSARHILPLSGGKDSTALAIYLLTNYSDHPFEPVFTDTGTELPETYDYLTRFEVLMGVKVHRVSALDLLKIRTKDNRSPFDIVLNELYGGFLPSPQARWCTRFLKIKPFEAFVGNDRAYSYLGIRKDENRAGYQTAKKPVMLSDRPNIVPVYPFKDLNLGLADVQRILEESGLGMPSYYEWRSRSGCFFCFYQQVGEWQGLRERHPDLFEKAKAYEKVENGRAYTWSQGRSLAELEQLDRRYTVAPAEDLEGCAICHL